jgi:competence transcription factor ComK
LLKPQNLKTHTTHTQNCYKTKFSESLSSSEMFMLFEKRKKNMKTYYVFVLLEKKERKGK